MNDDRAGETSKKKMIREYAGYMGTEFHGSTGKESLLFSRALDS